MAEAIRVAQVLNRMDSGGIEAVVMNYYRHMDRSKVQFDFYFAEGSDVPQRRELEQLHAGIYSIPSYTKVGAYHKALYQAFRERKYSVVHAHLSTMSLFPLLAAWRAEVPVRICHNHSTADWGEGKRTLLKYLLRPFGKVFATHYFACGERAGRWMYGNGCFDRGRVTVLPNAIDTAAFAYRPEARARLRKELDVPEDAFVVGHVGRFMYQKNHEFLVRVFAVLAAREPKAVLLLIGGGELEPSIRGRVEALGLEKRVIFTGVRSDVNELYSAMDVFCLPSFYEGMPVVAWEAQANGVPCVLSDRITREAVVNENVHMLPLEAGAEHWADRMMRQKRQHAAAVPDIRESAGKLEAFYLAADRQGAGRR